MKAICREQGRQLQWLARELEIKPADLSHIIAGRREPHDPLFYERMAAILRVPVADVKPQPEQTEVA